MSENFLEKNSEKDEKSSKNLKKCCKNCAHYYRDGVGTPGFSLHDSWWVCNITNSWHLPNWPFKNGCKHFELDPYLREDFDG
jgi:hypothetical protein